MQMDHRIAAEHSAHSGEGRCKQQATSGRVIRAAVQADHEMAAEQAAGSATGKRNDAAGECTCRRLQKQNAV
jgi:hypothetical protein